MVGALKGPNMDELMQELIAVANGDFDGHVTIMKFTGNWRVGFGTVSERCDIDKLAVGKSFEVAARSALATKCSVYDDLPSPA
jgi:hypothetical protein